jgi:hypothetical protein
MFVRYARDEAIEESQARELLLEWLQAELDGRPWPFASEDVG